MHFETVFDVVDVGYKNWEFARIGFILAAVSGTFFAFPRLARFIFSFGGLLSYRWGRSYYGWCFAFSVVWTLVAFGGTYGEYLMARNALTSGRYNVVEGVVSDFKPMPYSGHANERFTVAGQTFSYSDYWVTAGFNNTRSHGGPIDSGMYVRVTHTGNTILRLEIARRSQTELQ